MWTNFVIVDAGCSAALAGLVIVAISVNIARILEFPHLPARAAAFLIRAGSGARSGAAIRCQSHPAHDSPALWSLFDRCGRQHIFIFSTLNDSVLLR
jgi:hypothetical protein